MSATQKNTTDLKHRKQRSRQEQHQYTDEERAFLVEQFHLKNEHLAGFGTEVSPLEFYRDMFPEGSFEDNGAMDQRRPNGIANILIDKNKRGWKHNLIIFDDLKTIEDVQGQEFVIVSPVAYSGRKRLAKNAYQFFGICIDLDDVGIQEINNFFFQVQNDLLPLPSYVVNSGTGLHLYYLFDEPIPALNHIYVPLGKLKDGLTNEVWNRYTSRSKTKQYQNIFQGYRVPGTCTKFGGGCKVTAFKTGRRHTMRSLNDYVDPKNKPNFDDINYHNLESCKELYPSWYQRRVVENKAVGEYELDDVQKARRRKWYEAWKERARWEAKDGNRYYFMCVFFNYAMKAGIPLEEAEQAAMELLPILDSRTENVGNDFTEADIIAAKRYYNRRYIKFGAKAIKRFTGVDILTTKRNGRSQADHLKMARYVRDEIKGNADTWRNKDGRPTAENIMREYLEQHPGEHNKAKMARETGLDRKTVTKWWQIIVEGKETEEFRKPRYIPDYLYDDGDIEALIEPLEEPIRFPARISKINDDGTFELEIDGKKLNDPAIEALLQDLLKNQNEFRFQLEKGHDN